MHALCRVICACYTLLATNIRLANRKVSFMSYITILIAQHSHTCTSAILKCSIACNTSITSIKLENWLHLFNAFKCKRFAFNLLICRRAHSIRNVYLTIRIIFRGVFRTLQIFSQFLSKPKQILATFFNKSKQSISQSVNFW